MSFRILTLMLATLCLAACATPPRFQDPHQATAQDPLSLGRSALLLPTSHMAQHLDSDKSILYSQSFGGGGLATGLMFGPLGTAANIAMINSITKEDTQQMFGKLQVDPVESFSRAAERMEIPVQSQGSTSHALTPYLYVTKTSESSLSIATALIFESAGRTPAKYMYQLPGSYSVQQLSTLDAQGVATLQSEVDAGFARVLGLFSTDTTSAYEQSITIKSDFLSPRFTFDVQGAIVKEETDVVWLRSYGGVFGLQKSLHPSLAFR